MFGQQTVNELRETGAGLVDGDHTPEALNFHGEVDPAIDEVEDGDHDDIVAEEDPRGHLEVSEGEAHGDRDDHVDQEGLSEVEHSVGNEYCCIDP
jgi:hypothetical protein